MGKLTAREIQALTAPGMYAAGVVPGLYLCIAKGGSKSWIYRFQLNGRRRDAGLGSLTTFSLAEARDRGLELRRAVARGIDPVEAKRAERTASATSTAKAMTFRQCAEAYIDAHEAGWRNPKHRWQWGASLESYVYPFFGAVPVQSVDVGLVMKAVAPIWTTKTETASRVRGRIESVLDWATASGHRKGDNPARWRGHLENLLAERNKVARVEHHAALPYQEIGAFMAELRQQTSVAARALEFTILSAARTSETIGATWAEINMADRVWIVPADRIKGGREHRVPLSNAAMAVIEQMAAIRSSDFVFPGQSAGKPLSNMALLMLMRRMGRGDLTTHGFRSSFRDWCAERTNFPSEVAEMALAHVVGDKVEAAYRRGDLFEKRRQLADAWARFCAMPVEAGEVVPIRGA
jgi:integrase